MVEPAFPLRDAASVLLVRGEPLEVMMVRRTARASFASSYVFPGGVVEAGDGDEDWLPHLIGAEGLSAVERAARIAGCRETFEETAILLATAPGSAARERTPCPTTLPFLQLLIDRGLQLDLTRLVPFAHWLTPPGMPRRFDTRFYIAIAPADQAGSSDGTEITDIMWDRPAVCIDEALSGSRNLFFPTLANLERLSETETVGAALRRASERPLSIVSPTIKEQNGEKIIVLPDGSDYRRLTFPFQEQ